MKTQMLGTLGIVVLGTIAYWMFIRGATAEESDMGRTETTKTAKDSKLKGVKAQMGKKVGDTDESQDQSIASEDAPAQQLEQDYNEDNRTPTGVAVASVSDQFDGHHTLDEGVDVNAERIDPGHIRNASHEAAEQAKAKEEKH